MANDKYIVYFISRTKEKMIQFIENNLKEQGLEELITSQGNILTALYDNNGKLAMNQIAQKIGKDKSTVTHLITKLVKLGYIAKEHDCGDKRVTTIVLTEKGLQLKPKFDLISSKVYETAYKGFSEEEKLLFLKLLRKMNNNF